MLLISELDHKLLHDVSSFILRNEQECITLSSLFHSKEPVSLPSSSYKVFVFAARNSGNDSGMVPGRGLPEIKGIISFSSTGQLLHCLRFTEKSEEQEFCRFISTEIPDDRLFCILGEKNGTDLIKNCMKQRPVKEIDYTLMHYAATAEKLKIPFVQGFGEGSVERSTDRQLNRLLGLQEGYEKEEVLLKPEDFDPDFSRLNLRKQLREQIIYELDIKKDGFTKAIAKAGTNARGRRWYQVGGVFTLPEYRGLGCASFLVQHAAAGFANEGINTALFVRNSNIKAQHAYRKAGFVEDKPFKICYY